MSRDALLSDADWVAMLAEIGANAPRRTEAFAIVAQQYPTYAKQYRTYFLALTAEGFTPEQALDIVKAHGWIPR